MTSNNQDKPKKSFIQRFKDANHDHPVLMNLLYVIIASSFVIWLLLLFLDSWTHHGDEAIVPSLKGNSIELATMTLENDGFPWEIMDSVYETVREPGTVVEQTPCAGSRVKPGRKVYLTIVAFSPKMVTVPDFMNVSMRQGRSMFEGLGLDVKVVTVPSEYKDLVLGAKINGKPLKPGQRVPVTSSVTLEVGGGIEDDIDSIDIDLDTDGTAEPAGADTGGDDPTVELLLRD